nr:sigma-70 family RNA polymerase sigma factor [Spirochaetota bacterium]
MELIENKNSYFEDLVSSYQKPLVRVVNNLIYSEEDAKDITQEVFIVFYNNIEKFRGESSVFTYLYRIALNKSIDYLRKNKKKRFE